MSGGTGGGGFSGVTSAGSGVNVGGTNAWGNALGTGASGSSGGGGASGAIMKLAPEVLKGIGTGLNVSGQYTESKAQQEALLYNAQVARQQALITGTSAAYNTQRLKKRARILLATQTARYAKSGVRFDRGTPVDVMANSAAEYEMDILAEEYNAKVEMMRLENQAQLDEIKARSVKSAGNTGIASTLLQQGAGFVTNYFLKRSAA